MKTMKTQPPLLQAALQLERQGCSLIPVGPDKKPLVPWKPFQCERAMSEQLTSWFGSKNMHGVAIVTGAISGRVVLDIDGDEGFEALLTRGFQLPPTLTVRTPRGGSHFYFEDPGIPTKNFAGGTSTCRLTKVDFRGDGGYIIAPPTPCYEYVEPLPLAPMPDWLRCLTIPGWPLLDKAITKATANGQRNDVGLWLACQLRDARFLQTDAEPLLCAFAKEVRNTGAYAYTEQEALATVASAYSRSPRQQHDSKNNQMAILAKGIELFHSSDQVAFANLPKAAYSETWPLHSQEFQRWLSHKLYEETGQVPSSSRVNDILRVLEGRALFSSPEVPVNLRVAEHENAIVIDLCNAAWECVVVDATGWQVEKNSPVKFRRTRGMLPLPTPISGGDLNEILKLSSLTFDEDQWHLLVVLMLSAMRPRGPYPVGCIQGEQGSGKSTLVRMIRALIDPSVSPVRSEPREVRDLLISAKNSWLLAFDNLSYVAPWLSDALCRLSTGGGFATRELYTNQEEIILDAQRPVLLNGIEALISRSDLLDRSVIISLPTIEESQRRSESTLLRTFEKARPRLFGSLLTGLSRTLACLPDVRLDRLPRMADFALFGVACEQALGWPAGSFLTAYEKNLQTGHVIALEGSPIVAPLEQLLDAQTEWNGTATQLLQELSMLAGFEATRKRGWPASERQVGAQLSRLAPNLRAIGISVEKERSGHERTRLIHLTKVKMSETSSASSACPQAAATQGAVADNGADNPTGKDEPRIVRQNSKLRAAADKAVKAVKADKEKPQPSKSDSKVHSRLEELGKMWRRVKVIPNPAGVKHRNNHNDKGRRQTR